MVMLAGSGAGAPGPAPLPFRSRGAKAADYRGQAASMSWNACSMVF
jgi:hypothetical protein